MQKTTVNSLDKIYDMLAAIKGDLDTIATASDPGLPTPAIGDAGKVLAVSETGAWELIELPTNTDDTEPGNDET